MADLADGEVAYVQGSAANPYEIRNTGGVFSCTCPAWRHQGLAIDQRTCKHIKKLRGAKAEIARIGDVNPAARTPAEPTTAAPVLLAHKWEPHVDVTGWWLSEKLDGVRAYWDGEKFLSRLGNRFFAPDWFVDELPDVALDGELWIGRGAFQKTVSVVRRQDRSEHWREVSFLVFDAPDHGGVFEERVTWMDSTLAGIAGHVGVVDHDECKGTEHLQERLAEIEALGGEGVMARQPGSKYVAGRSHTLLKVKSFLDTEAEVIGHLPGSGKHKGRLGSLRARLADGTEFSVGTGLSDRERENPPAVGAVVTVRYQELSRDGVPRFPAYIGERHDVAFKAVPQDKDPAKPIKTKVKKKKAEPGKTDAKAKPAAEQKGKRTMADGLRYFEYKDDKSNKFWEISVSGSSHTVRYGRIGADGTTKTKDFDNDDAAEADADKLIAQKTKKGYVESDS